MVIIDLAGTRDGEPLPDATAEGITYTDRLGRHARRAGRGRHRPGRRASPRSSAPPSSGGPLQGETADINVTVTKVSTQEICPVVDDEFALLVSEFDTRR